MKRYVCTVAAGLLFALASTGTATATGLPLPGQQSGTQNTSFGDQSVGEQRNDADVTQKQGNGNLNIAPAVAIGGDAESTNKQGTHNTATADVDQSNSAEQTQSSTQKQSLAQSGNGCCDGQSQTPAQTVNGGDQSVEKQKNEADVNQYQGNGNVNVSPAVAVFGDAETTNYQGNGNDADATVTQSNEATQSQSSTQKQYASQDGGNCCYDGRSQTGEQNADFGDQTVGKQKNEADVNQYQGNGNVNVSPAVAIFGDAKTINAQGNHNTATADLDQSNSVDQAQSSHQEQKLQQYGGGCCNGQSQTSEQNADFGDQYVGKQRNDADVTQKQGNGNLNVSPAIAIGGGWKDDCRSTCKSSSEPSRGNASTTNYQGNGNHADATVTQSNEATQSQSSTQKQYASQDGGNCCKQEPQPCKASDPCKPSKEYGESKDTCCANGSSQSGTQEAHFGDQSVEKQRNDADVTQKQGNGNANVSPAIAFGGKDRYEHESCKSKCTNDWKTSWGDASTTNSQGNRNEANADVDQRNSVEQTQTSYQRQSVVDMCKGLVHR